MSEMRNSSGRLAAICGLSPMPVALAIETFAPEELVIVHGPGGGRAVAERLLRTYQERLRIDLIEVPLDDPPGVGEAIDRASDSAGRSVLADLNLLYGPGTVPMNVAVYNRWIRTAGDADRAWYLAARARRFRSDLGEELDLRTEELSVETIAQLHVPADFSIDAGWDLMPMIAALTDKDIDNAAKLVDELLGGGHSASEVYKQLTWSQPVGDVLKVVVRSEDANIKGYLLEVIVAILLGRYFEGQLNELRTSVKASKDGMQCYEVDLVLRSAENVMVISCGTADGALKEKFNEVDQRTRQLVGSESRGLVVGMKAQFANRQDWPAESVKKNMDDERQRLLSGDVPDRFNAVSLHELFSDPSDSSKAVLSDPQGHLRLVRPDIGAWLDAWLTPTSSR